MIRLFYSAVCAAIAPGILAGCSGSSIGSSNSSLPSLRPRLSASPAGHLGQQTSSSGYQLLYSFGGTNSRNNGSYPAFAALVDVAGTLYGTTCEGGENRDGTVFKISTSGTESVIYNFAGGSDGAAPYAGLTNVGGTLYGTTFGGGASDEGTVFKITTSGTESVIHSFALPKDGIDPEAGLKNVAGTLYGTTFSGGANRDGTVFKITTSGTEKVIHSFGRGNDGAAPIAGLANVAGTLYGTTQLGGESNEGTVFKITTSGTETVLHSFADDGKDGEQPYAGLIVLGSTLYGTTESGGAHGVGTLFKITTSGAEKVLYSFSGGSSDGAYPWAGVTYVLGTLYGTTTYGGINCTTEHGCGTLFSIKPSGKSETVLHRFSGSGGSYPIASMINVGGTLYATTSGGGASNGGTVFSFAP